MRKPEIEAWVYRAVDRVKSGQQLEDALLEAKAQWIEPQKAARRIAGHCNAARGSPVLWLFGLDETRGVVGVPPQNLANWWPAVAKEFEGPTPLSHDLVVEADGKAMVALLFDTDQPPYVVKSRVGAEREVPWREGTGIISARHEHLIRMLVPRSALPHIDLVEGSLSMLAAGAIAPTGADGPGWKLVLHLYVTPRADHDVTLPNHLCRVSWRTDAMPTPVESRYPTFGVFHRGYRSPTLPPPVNVHCSQTEAIFKGPGMFTLTVERVAADPALPRGGQAHVRTTFGTPGGEHEVIVEATMQYAGQRTDELASWEVLSHGIRVG